MTPQYYIVNALGFALQLVPVMFVVLRPFGAGRYRMPRRKLMAALAVFGVLASAAFPLATCFIDVVDPAIVGNIYLLVAAVVFAVIYFRVVDDLPARKALSFVLGVVYGAVQYSVVNLLLPFVVPPGDYLVADPYSLWGTVFYAATTAIMLPLMVLFQERALRRYHPSASRTPGRAGNRGGFDAECE